jgi:aspartate kinase
VLAGTGWSWTWSRPRRSPASPLTTDRREPLPDRALAELEAWTVASRTERPLPSSSGRHLAERAGLGAAILQATADAGVNVEMVSYGMKSLSLTMPIPDRDVGKAA